MPDMDGELTKEEIVKINHYLRYGKVNVICLLCGCEEFTLTNYMLKISSHSFIKEEIKDCDIIMIICDECGHITLMKASKILKEPRDAKKDHKKE